MNREEFKIRALRSLIKPEYFYIPVRKKSDEKIIRYVVSSIDNPFSYPDFYLIENYDEYVYNDATDTYYPYPANQNTKQGQVYISDTNDDALRKGWCNRKYTSQRISQKIPCVKIYNGNNYLGLFAYVQPRIDNRILYQKFDLSHNKYDLLEESRTSARLDQTSVNVKYYTENNYTAPTRHKTNTYTSDNYSLYEEAFGIQGGEDLFSLNKDYQVISSNTTQTVEDRVERYRIYPYNHKVEYNYVLTNSSKYTRSTVHSLIASAELHSRYKITSGRNGIDLDKQNQGYYMQEDVQIDFPDIETEINTATLARAFSFPMARRGTPVINNYHNYNSIHVEWEDISGSQPVIHWTDDDDPSFSSSSSYLNCYYLGDGMTKEICSQYQRIFYYNDYQSVGAVGISYEVENPE